MKYSNCSFMVKVLRVGEPEISPKVDMPDIARDYWENVITRQTWFDQCKEHLVVLLLNTRYRVTAYSLVSIGSLNESIAHPRDVFRPAVAAGAYAMVVLHNHPSGDPSPSQTDHSLTRRLAEAAELLQIKLLDHVIVGQRGADSKEGYFSFKEAGVL
jgi:DNA repair protein RadC